MKKILWVLIVFPFLLGFTIKGNDDQIKKEIENNLNKMVEYWNSGELDKYISFYANTEDITMQSSKTRFYGINKIRSLFVDSFAKEETRGKLIFSEVSITVLSNESAYAIGKFNLQYPNGNKREGYYTVVFKKLATGWKIVHDQS
jgi:ketosteroid isomerase-like protein